MKDNHDCREEFYKLMKEQGFESLQKFCKASGIAVGNLHANLRGRDRLSIKRAFIIATTLKVAIDIILEMFYPEEMEEMWNAIED